MKEMTKHVDKEFYNLLCVVYTINYCSFLSVLVSILILVVIFAGGTFLSSCTNLSIDLSLLSNTCMSNTTYHFTLAHKASWIPIKTKKCRLPFVRYADQRKTKNSSANAASTAKRNVGWRDEPGFRMNEMNEGSSAESDAILVAVSPKSEAKVYIKLYSSIWSESYS